VVQVVQVVLVAKVVLLAAQAVQEAPILAAMEAGVVLAALVALVVMAAMAAMVPMAAMAAPLPLTIPSHIWFLAVMTLMLALVAPAGQVTVAPAGQEARVATVARVAPGHVEDLMVFRGLLEVLEVLGIVDLLDPAVVLEMLDLPAPLTPQLRAPHIMLELFIRHRLAITLCPGVATKNV
jgi:hypothetical protein